MRSNILIAFVCYGCICCGCSGGCRQPATPPLAIRRPAAPRIVPAPPPSSRAVPAPIESAPLFVPDSITGPDDPPGEGNPSLRKVPGDWRPAADADSREWRFIVLHHTATGRGSVDSIHEAHLRRKWIGIGYHFVIGNGDGMPDGAIEPTFRWREQLHGAHAGNTEYNQHGIGICLVGNFEEEPPTRAQTEAVTRLVGYLKHEYSLTDSDVIAHREVKATACPGRYFPLDEVRASAWSAARPHRKIRSAVLFTRIRIPQGAPHR